MKTLLFLGAGASTQFNERMPTEFTFFKQYLDQRPKYFLASGPNQGKGIDQFGRFGFQHFPV